MTEIHSDTNTLIWDLDGTMLDSLGVLEDALSEVLPSYNRQLPSHEVMLANFHGSLEDSIDHSLGGLEPTELAAIVRDFLVVQDNYYDVIEKHLFPDATSLAKRAHDAGYKQILVTNRAHEGRLKASPRSIVANSELRDYIDVVICGDDSEHRKPKPAVLGALVSLIVPSEVLVVGDQFVDAEFAKNLGSAAVLVNRNGHQPMHMERLGEDWCDFTQIVASLDEVRL